MKAVLQHRVTAGFRQQVEALQSDRLQIEIVDVSDKASFRREMADTDVLLHVLEPVNAEVIAAAPCLKLIQKLGVGVDTIDLVSARERGVAVCNMPGTNTQAVAEMTLLLMLATLRRLHELSRELLHGSGWRLNAQTLDGLGELAGRTVGLVGFGAVGQRLLPMLRGMRTRVVYTCRKEVSGVDAVFMSTPELLSQSDIVSLHVPLTPTTAKMINADTLEKMKPGAILINTARGGLVDEGALVEALTTGHLGGAGLDVFAAEPVDMNNPLLRCPNVVVTPHLAWLTSETLARSLSVFQENCRRLRDGEELLHRVV
jgi:phosphoglycerate dehydrogenase-like enzyme